MAYPSITINQRFATLIQVLNLTKSSFAHSLDKTPSVVQHLIDGRNKPGYDLLCRVFEVYPNVSRDWLILGRGPMLLSGEAPPAPAPLALPAPAAAPELPLYAPEPTAPTAASSEAAAVVEEVAKAAAAPAAAPETAAATPPAAAPELPFAAPEIPRPTPPRAAPDAPLRAVDIAAVLAASARASRPAAGEDFAASAAPAASPFAVPVAAPAVALSPTPGAAEAFVAALQMQQLQHQLAMAELRNQHLLEQHGLLREMLELAKRGLS